MADPTFELRENGKMICILLSSGVERCVGISAEQPLTDRLAQMMLAQLSESVRDALKSD